MVAAVRRVAVEVVGEAGGAQVVVARAAEQEGEVRAARAEVRAEEVRAAALVEAPAEEEREGAARAVVSETPI